MPRTPKPERIKEAAEAFRRLGTVEAVAEAFAVSRGFALRLLWRAADEGLIEYKPRPVSRIAEAAALYNAGRTPRQIAEQFGLTKSRIRQILLAGKMRGIVDYDPQDRERRRITTDDVRAAVMKTGGIEPAATLLGIAYATVRSRFPGVAEAAREEFLAKRDATRAERATRVIESYRRTGSGLATARELDVGRNDAQQILLAAARAGIVVYPKLGRWHDHASKLSDGHTRAVQLAQRSDVK